MSRSASECLLFGSLEDSVPLIIAIVAVIIYGAVDFGVAPCLKGFGRSICTSEGEEKQMRYMQARARIPLAL